MVYYYAIPRHARTPASNCSRARLVSFKAPVRISRSTDSPVLSVARSPSRMTNDRINACRSSSAFTLTGSVSARSEDAFFNTSLKVQTSTPVRLWNPIIDPSSAGIQSREATFTSLPASSIPSFERSPSDKSSSAVLSRSREASMGVNKNWDVFCFCPFSQSFIPENPGEKADASSHFTTDRLTAPSKQSAARLDCSWARQHLDSRPTSTELILSRDFATHASLEDFWSCAGATGLGPTILAATFRSFIFVHESVWINGRIFKTFKPARVIPFSVHSFAPTLLPPLPYPPYLPAAVRTSS